MVAPRAGLRTQVIRVLKIGFPLTAVALLASVFILSDKPLPEPGLNFSTADLEAMRGGLKVDNPQLSGASLTGDIYDFAANTVVPRDETVQEAGIDGLSGSIDYRGGRRVELEAARAEINLVHRTLLLETGIRLRTSDGYDATADRVEVDAVAAVITATGMITASGPLGDISAESLRIEPLPDDQDPSLGKASVLRFGGGVSLRYMPAATQRE